MDKFDKLKITIFQIIGENNYLLAALEQIKQRGDKLPSIVLSYSIGDKYIHSSNTIEIGIPDIIDCFKISSVCTSNFEFKFKIQPCYFERGVSFRKCKGIIVYNDNLVVSDVKNKLNDSIILDDINKLSWQDVLTIYSLAYSLYHEIGHAIYDKYIPESEPIKRETAADTFAFEALKSMCDIENRDFLLLGTIIGVANVFWRLSYEQEKDDDKHPYTIERLYKLLMLWGIEDDSSFWALTTNIIKKWCKQNMLSMEWNSDDSNLDKEKFIKAYTLFRRNP